MAIMCRLDDVDIQCVSSLGIAFSLWSLLNPRVMAELTFCRSSIHDWFGQSRKT